MKDPVISGSPKGTPKGSPKNSPKNSPSTSRRGSISSGGKRRTSCHRSDTSILNRRNSHHRAHGSRPGSRQSSNGSQNGSPHRRNSDETEVYTPWDAYKRHRSVTYIAKKWDRDKMLNDDQKQYLQDFFHKEPCLYGHEVFGHAAKLYDVLKHDLNETNPERKRRKADQAKRRLANMAPLDYSSLSEQRSAFRLTFSALKYQRFLEEMLDMCSFYYRFPQYREDASLVEVMLCDLKLRKFQLRTPLPNELQDPHLTKIETSLNACTTKLSAALARSRIKACVLTVDHLLPESVRKNDKYAAKMHVSAWVNYSRTNLQAVLDVMEKEGFTQVHSGDRIIGKSFYVDHHCSDMLVFPGDLREFLEEYELVTKFHLVLQDKSSCIGPQSVRHLINLGDDILIVNLGKGLTLAHLASLTHGSDSMIFGFGLKSEKQFKEVMDTLDKAGCKARCRVFEEAFSDISWEDERFKHIKVALVSADCSRSGVANPIDFIVSEGEDMGILKDLSLGSLDDFRLGELVVDHNTAFRHTMRFPRVQAVVYCTRSLNEAENESVVTQGIEYANQVNVRKTPFRLAPPVVPLTDEEIEKEHPLFGKYLKFLPSACMSGCFVATVTREADDPKQAAKDILARAAARGVISGLPANTVRRKSKSATKLKADKKKKPEKAGSKTTVSTPVGLNLASTPGPKVASDAAVGPRHASYASLAVFGSLRAVSSLSHKNILPMSPELRPELQRLTASMLRLSAGSPSSTNARASLSPPAHQVVVHHPAPFR